MKAASMEATARARVKLSRRRQHQNLTPCIESVPCLVTALRLDISELGDSQAQA